MKTNNCFGRDLYGFRNNIDELASFLFKDPKSKRRKLDWFSFFFNVGEIYSILAFKEILRKKNI